MARQARNANTYGIYHIYQQGHGERPLFANEEDRVTWLGIIARARDKFGFKLYAYCASHPQEYHLVLNLQGGDISKVMKSINIAYAMYAKCSGQLFKDRYRSRVIDNKEQLLALMAQIHRRSQAQEGMPDPYNSFCCYRGLVQDQKTPLDMADLTVLDEVVMTSKEGGKVCNQCIQSLAEAQAHLQKKLSGDGMSEEEMKKDKAYRNQLIIRFRHESTLSLKELGQLFGGLSESAVSKIISGHYENTS